jgi:hypothetical protein
MAHRRVEAANAVREVVRAAGAYVTIKMTGHNHQVAEIEFGGRSRKVFFASTSSDRNGFKNAARWTRRVLQEMGAPV